MLGKIPNEKIPDCTILVWSYTTNLFNAFNSIWHSALFHQLIALDFLLSFVIYIHFFLSDRWTEITFYGAGSHFLKQMQYCPSLCPVFSLFILLMDYLTEIFATEAKTLSLYAGNLVILGSLLQTYTRSWKDYKKPLYLQSHWVKCSVFTSNLLEMQIVLQVGPPSSFIRPPTNLFSIPLFQLSLFIKNSWL